MGAGVEQSDENICEGPAVDSDRCQVLLPVPARGDYLEEELKEPWVARPRI